MIDLICTKCQASLSVDDAFAGGVCRCKQCGTIQTVPAVTARPPVPTTSAHAVPASAVPANSSQQRALYQTPGSSLEELAQVVSSGLASSSGLTEQTAPRRRSTRPPNPAVTLLFIGGGIGLVMAGALVTWLIMRQNAPVTRDNPPDQPPIAPNQQVSTPSAVPHPAKGPSFAGVALTGPTIIYVLDHGIGTVETFDHVKLLTLSSLRTLRPEMKFQIIFWKTDALLKIPAESLASPVQAELDKASSAIDEVFAFGASDVGPAMREAMARNPAEIVLVSGKFGLDDAFVKSVLEARGTSPVKIHTFALGRSPSSDAMRSIAQKTGGQFRQLGMDDLRDLEQ